jgi:hypothetical protein
MTPSTETTSYPAPRIAASASATRLVELFLLIVAGCFLVLHAVHLGADFPNHSPWMDWSKYTDEGWYGDAAIRHFQRGSWYVPGDFNPAAALPVWPLVESVVFRFAGVSLVAARGLTVGIFGLILATVFLLVRRWQSIAPGRELRAGSSLAPAIAVLLLAVSPFCYVFSRLAILEPMLILLMLLALLAASYASPKMPGSTAWRVRLFRMVPILALGALLPLMILTKTTALFLLPSVAWILFARAEYNVRSFLKLAAPALGLGTVVWMAYYGIAVRPHFLSDYKYLFSANAYTGITRENAVDVLRDTFVDGMWIGRILYPLGLLSACIALFFNRKLLRNPLIPALLLWAIGYAAFLAYHDNLQPRYYLVIAIPLTLLAAIVFESIWNRGDLIAPLHHMGAAIAAVALAVIAVSDARQTIDYVSHPEYTFATAANSIRDIITAERTHNPLVLSISGSDLSLMTGVPSICDDFGTLELADRVRQYQPGWYVAWNQVDDDKMDALTPLYQLRRVASFPAMDDPERNLLILYRLDPATKPPATRHRAKPIPRLLQTSFGQQPNPIQLQH